MMGFVPLKEAALERLPFFSYVRTQEGSTSTSQRRKLSPETELWSSLILDFPAFPEL